MKFSRGFSLITMFFIVIIMMAVVFGFTYFSGKDGLRIIINNLSYFTPLSNMLKQTPQINDFYVDGNNYVVKGKSLSKVEISYTLNTTDPNQTFDQMISEGSDHSEFFLIEKFNINIACGPFSPVKVFVTGYDEQGKKLINNVLLSPTKNIDFYSINCPKDPKVDTRNGIFVLDSVTGLNIPNFIISINGKQFSDSQSFIDYAKSLPSGATKISINATGYKELKDISFFIPASLSNNTFSLAPLKYNNSSPKQPKDKLRIWGYLRDEIHNPLSSVFVSLVNYNLNITTDDNGFFYIDISPQTADLCTNNTLVFTKDGYRKSTITNFGSGYIKTGFEGTEVKVEGVLKKEKGETSSDQKYHMCP